MSRWAIQRRGGMAGLSAAEAPLMHPVAIAGVTSFSVNGLPVTTDAGTSFPDGAAGVALGVAVEVKGRLAGDGVTVEALQIKFEQ